jgi:hypothetical protein
MFEVKHEKFLSGISPIRPELNSSGRLFSGAVNAGDCCLLWRPALTLQQRTLPIPGHVSQFRFRLLCRFGIRLVQRSILRRRKSW